MSYRIQVRRVLEILGWSGHFDYVATRDDVGHGKPDPEIYLLVARELGVPPWECLVVEDSPAGVEAARAAGMWCIAVASPSPGKRSTRGASWRSGGSWTTRRRFRPPSGG
jgi:beta-phosphoglucomutase-like phosphatase (HAD superfamily)